jgi:plastocyanin
MDRRRLAVVLVLAVGALAVIALPSAFAGGGGGCHKATQTQGDTTVVDMKANCFAPTVTTVDVGDTVEWTNSDEFAHAVVGATGEWSTPEIGAKESGAVRFDSPRVFPYWCSYHMGMIGAVVVGDGRPDSKAAGTGPVAVPVKNDPPSGAAAAEAGGAASAAGSSDDGVAPVAAVAIALLSGIAGYGLALVVRRRDPGLEAAKRPI